MAKQSVLDLFLKNGKIALEDIYCIDVTFHSGKAGTIYWNGKPVTIDPKFGCTLSMKYDRILTDDDHIAGLEASSYEEFLASIDATEGYGIFCQREGMDVCVWSKEFIFLFITQPFLGISVRYIRTNPL